MSHDNYQGSIFEDVPAADSNEAAQKPKPASSSTPSALAGRPPTWWRYNELMNKEAGYLRDHAHTLVELTLGGKPSVEIREMLMACRAPGCSPYVWRKQWIEFILRVEGYADWDRWESSYVIVPKRKEYTIVVDGEVLYVVDPPPPTSMSEARKKRIGRK